MLLLLLYIIIIIIIIVEILRDVIFRAVINSQLLLPIGRYFFLRSKTIHPNRVLGRAHFF